VVLHLVKELFASKGLQSHHHIPQCPNQRATNQKCQYQCIFEFDFNEITPSKLLGNNIKVKEKFSVVIV
jgi:hypothetical protein